VHTTSIGSILTRKSRGLEHSSHYDEIAHHCYDGQSTIGGALNSTGIYDSIAEYKLCKHRNRQAIPYPGMLDVNTCRHVTFMRGASRERAWNPRVVWKRALSVSSDTRHSTLHSTQRTHTSTTHTSTLNINNSRNGWRKRYVRAHSLADAPLARANIHVFCRLTRSCTGKTGGKTGGKAGGDSTGKTQKSHSAKAGLQVCLDMQLFRDGTQARSGNSGFFCARRRLCVCVCRVCARTSSTRPRIHALRACQLLNQPAS